MIDGSDALMQATLCLSIRLRILALRTGFSHESEASQPPLPPFLLTKRLNSFVGGNRLSLTLFRRARGALGVLMIATSLAGVRPRERLCVKREQQLHHILCQLRNLRNLGQNPRDFGTMYWASLSYRLQFRVADSGVYHLLDDKFLELLMSEVELL